MKARGGGKSASLGAPFKPSLANGQPVFSSVLLIRFAFSKLADPLPWLAVSS